jgi:hypothetical protein
VPDTSETVGRFPIGVPAMSRTLLIASAVVLMSGWPPAPVAQAEATDQPPLVVPPPVTVAGSRIGFTGDPLTGRINVHFMEGFHPGHVDVLRQQKPLGTVFLTSMRQPIKDSDLALLHDVPMTGLFVSDAPLTDKGLEALKGHPHLESILLYKTKVTDAGLDTLGTLPRLVRVWIDYGDITDAGLAKIAACKNLTSVGFYKCPKITDDGVIQLAKLPALRQLLLSNNDQLTRRVVKPLCALTDLDRLELDEIKLTADDVAEVSRLPKLEVLGLSKTGVDDEGARHLGQMKLLKSLVIQYAAISDAGVTRLKTLTGLRTLGLEHTAVTDRGVTELAGLADLGVIGLAHTRVTDAGAKELAKHPKLRYLDLAGTKVSDAGLKELAGLKHLGVLYLEGTQVTKEGLAELHEALPKCSIFHPAATFRLPRPKPPGG